MSDVMLKIVNSRIEFPNIEIVLKEKVGIYTKNPHKFLNNLLKIIIKPKKYTEEYILEGIDAENLSYFSRRIFHIVSPNLWNNKDILKILKSKSENRKIIVLSEKDENLNIYKIFEIKKIIDNSFSDENFLIITDSKELLEAICDKVIDENGNQIPFEEGAFLKRFDTMEEIEKLDEIEGHFLPLIFKKKVLNLR
ncbi:hypothetical protein JCM30566_05260 [Marinitoga arctica]